MAGEAGRPPGLSHYFPTGQPWGQCGEGRAGSALSSSLVPRTPHKAVPLAEADLAAVPCALDFTPGECRKSEETTDSFVVKIHGA